MHILNIYNIQKGSRGNIQVFFQPICHALLLNWVSRIFSAYILYKWYTQRGPAETYKFFFSTNLPHPYVKSVHTHIYCIFNKKAKGPAERYKFNWDFNQKQHLRKKVNLSPRAEREGEEIWVNLSPLAKREAEEVLVNL